MSQGLQEQLSKVLTYVTLVAIVVIGSLMMYPNYRRSQALKIQNAELQEQIESKKREIAKLLDNQRRFKTDPDFVEMIARQNHRMFPGELVFLFNKE